MPRTLKLPLVVCALAALLPLCAPEVRARQAAPDTQFEHGVALYRRGDVKGAVKEFRAVVKRRQDDPLAWVYLGQALARRGELKDARKALDAALKLDPGYARAHSSLAYVHVVSGKDGAAEAAAAKAIALDPKLTDAHYVLGLLRLRQGAWPKALEEADAIIKLDPKVTGAYLLKAQALLGLFDSASMILAEGGRGAHDHDEAAVGERRVARTQWLREASESLAEYLRLRPDAEDADRLREDLAALRFYAEASSSADPARKVYTASDGVSRAVLLAKPEPGFTEDGRRAGVNGTVRLRAVLGADGTVKHILVLRRLGHGLTEKAVAAARQIKFKPATLAGRPVSQYVVLEYNFNVY
ncbi:MAG TPA: TonB family protein [Pyrinomonadaceae bacterium]|jgi:TonB family protein